MIQRPCLWCGKLSSQSRCAECETKYQEMRIKRIKPRKKPSRKLYAGSYKRRAKKVVDAATTCWICGGGKRDHDPFTADHVIPGDADSLLLAAHRSCNSRRGNRTRRV